LAQRSKPLARRFAGFTVGDPEVVLIGRESIYRDGALVGWLSSGGWGYTVGANIGFGYVRRGDGVSEKWLTGGRYELEVGTKRVPAEIHLRPLYDPIMARMKA
jgi:4-methylaminobutanoate oxidase (formaldehyde-forming)